MNWLGHPNSVLPPLNRRRSNDTGFTLIELVIVSVLIVVLTAAVMPVFNGTWSDVTREGAIKDLMGAMKYAQTRAISEATPYRIYFHVKKNSYWIARRVEMENGGKSYEPLTDRYGEYTVLPDKLRLENPKARKDGQSPYYYLSFLPSGACDVAIIRIARVDKKNQRYEISTDGKLGQFGYKEP